MVENDKYEKGILVSEDEEFITVKFERYEDKIFTNMFTILRVL
ncbi:hypothetical protein CLPUN_33960 [Clostridium puniceum]|uniref:Uncharacterized protein n=1 Tax=Clostridium puniceum TaxID=29367 RepID=A0A1S8TBZ9_9CLOT|nr:hypothetical protein [Clostridium puniceum]OOM75266.1 hypothetical protein CLPUN_33960 [Clostridium puniceum]